MSSGRSAKPVRAGIKVAIVATAVILVVAFATFGLAKASNGDEVQAPAPVTAESRCPVAGCTAEECHGPNEPPDLEDGQLMYCPRVPSCSSTTCHEADKLTSHYRQANDLSLNLWIVGLGVVTVVAVALAKKKN